MTQNRQVYSQPPKATEVPQYADPDKPAACEQIPADACAGAYQTKGCSSGWKLDIPKGGEIGFKWKTHYFAYKNRIELIGVRPGCSLTVFDKNNFTGDQVTITSDGEFNKYVSLADVPEYVHLNNQIESVKCVCN
eukprot:TRINITY_DN2812_c0_g1_i2.p1 TRINITY_DN2812_c0_g1~~TRINITY_DN2812_c0_g1_i2.p1  ORF type:complete len:135 (-),score=37.73 TRINITY_DN2812_c0_g1_i2:103-507(-)